MTDNSVPAVAIIGCAGRFPGARNPEEFWDNIARGIESVTELSAEECRRNELDPTIVDAPSYVRRGALLDDVEYFDAEFFGFSPGEAAATDPQQRLFLECCWEALEDAGIDPDRAPGPIAVFAGAGTSTYAETQLAQARRRPAFGELMPLVIGNNRDFLATRVAYKFGLTGPALTLQTACSTSLVAVHYACQSLLLGESDVALAGGVAVRTPLRVGYIHEPGGILSADGHCRAFDRESDGTVPGNGAGVVVLRRLDDALRAGDRVLAVIRGSAVNNDGRAKVGYTAPGADGQARVLAEALAVADIEPDTVSYVEAHGTGTRLGDPIEFAALREVYGSRSVAGPPCYVGTVKSNIGHLDTAAGIAGLIKVVGALRQGLIPATMNFRAANQLLGLGDGSALAIADRSRTWESAGPRRAGVSSFGLGGTNVHVVLEQAPATRVEHSTESQLLVLSAADPLALDEMVAALFAHLAAHPELSIRDVAHTLHTGRKVFAHRFAQVVDNKGRPLGEPIRGSASGARGAAPAVSISDAPSPAERAQQLAIAARAWVDGAECDWKGLYFGRPARKVKLPGYRFQRSRHWLGATPERPTARYGAGRTPTESAVAEIWGSILGLTDIERTENYFGLGGDSLRALRMARRVTETFGVPVTLQDLVAAPTLGEFCAFLDRAVSGTGPVPDGTATPLIYLNRNGSRPPIVLVHPGGGSALTYLPLAAAVGADQPLICIQSPTYRGGVESDSVEDAATVYLADLAAAGIEFRELCGWSYGGNVAFEMARRVRKETGRVVGVYLIDSLPPAAYPDRPPSETELYAAFPVVLTQFGRAASENGTAAADSEVPADFDAAVAALRRAGALPEWLPTDAARTMFDVWRRHMVAVCGYRPGPAVTDIDITLLQATDPQPDALTELLRIDPDPLVTRTGWAELTTGRSTVHPIAGNHHSLIREGNVEVLAEVLLRLIMQSREQPGEGQ
ncbi:beta-ketoacyl synthase N-terminal-like domain-containing protein [Nocardia niigatensis]